MTALPESKPSRGWLFWLLTSACIWGYFVPLGIKKFIGYDVRETGTPGLGIRFCALCVFCGQPAWFGLPRLRVSA